MKHLLLITSIFITCAITAQEQKLVKIIGPDFIMVQPLKAYPATEKDIRVQIVPNLCLSPDTSGLVFNNEFVLFRQDEVSCSSTSDCYRFVQLHATTVGEYREYQDWVRDSLFRTALYLSGDITDKEAAKMLVYEKDPDGSEAQLNLSDRKTNIELYRLNRKYPLNLTDKLQRYILSNFYTPYNERFYGYPEFDERKWVYTSFSVQRVNGSRYVVTDKTATITNPYSWSVASGSAHDERAIIGQKYNTSFSDMPVVGITGMQARAFCHWKQRQIENELKRKKINAFVWVTLPSVSDIEQTAYSAFIPIPEKDYTEQWKITAADYSRFVNAVRDSITTELLYQVIKSDEDAVRLIQYDPEFFEAPIEMGESMSADPANREENRYLFPLRYDGAILKKYKTQVDSIQNRLTEIQFVYYWINAAKKGIVGEMELNPRGAVINCPDFWELQLKTSGDPKVQNYGMDLNLGQTNRFCQNTGVRSHKNLAEYIEKEMVNITPAIQPENQQPESRVKGITYKQALAYYNWKYPIWKMKEDDPWQNFVFPTKEQFEKVQQGETVIIGRHTIPCPTPFFRYVVHVKLLN